MSMELDPLDCLLNIISHEMNRQNLKSLIQICGIRGRDREAIKDGHDLFRILRQRGFISKDPRKIANLLNLMQNMKPKRRDLVDKVKEFIRNTVDAPEQIIVEFDNDSMEASLTLTVETERAPLVPVSSDSHSYYVTYCNIAIDCGSCGGPCPTCCSCSKCTMFVSAVVSTLFFVLLLIGAVICWYHHVPVVSMYLKQDEERMKAGQWVTGLLASLAFVSLIVAVYKWREKKNEYQHAAASSVQQTSTRPCPTFPTASHGALNGMSKLPPDHDVTDAAIEVSSEDQHSLAVEEFER